MSQAKSAWLEKALELLKDGQWRRRDWVINRCSALVPPSRARRVNERARRAAHSKDQPPAQRHRQRSDAYLIEAGRRRIVTDSLIGAVKRGALEKKTGEDGNVYLRIPPASALGRGQRRDAPLP